MGARGRRGADARGQHGHARARRRAGAGRVLQRRARHRVGGPPGGRGALRRARVVHRQRDGRAVAARPPGRGDLREAGQRGRQGDAARRPVDRARRVRQLALADADVRGLGGHGARPRVGRRRPHLAAHVLRPRALRDHRGLPGRLVGPRPHDRHRGGDRRRRRRPQAQPPQGLAQRRRVERLVPDAARGVRAQGQAVRGRAAAARGHLHDHRRTRLRLHADHAAAPRRPREDGVPGPARERDRADPHGRRRAGLAPDDVLPVPRRRAPRPRDRPARGARARRARGHRRP